MDGLRQYIISVVGAALICGIISSLIDGGTGKVLIKLLCGLFLTFTAIRPIADIDYFALTEYALPYSAEAEYISTAGEKMAGKVMKDIIKDETETYILDKATDLNADITVDVIVDDNSLPIEAMLGGEISPYARERLEEILESDLGITKENQIWTG